MPEISGRARELSKKAREFAELMELEYGEVDEETKVDIVARFRKGETIEGIRLELGEHPLVVMMVIEEAMQASIVERLPLPPVHTQFNQMLASIDPVYARNHAEKGDSWRTIDLDDLRDKAKEEFLEWMDAQGQPEELSEVVDLCLTILMLGERLVK